MIGAGRPIIFATSMARLRPGMPVIMRYVGCPVAESNSIDALTMCESFTANVVSAERCVVTIISAPIFSKCSITAAASAAPSSGSVPDPSSSSSTSERSVALSSTRLRRTRYAEKVERCSSSDWSSPMSTWKASTIGMIVPSAAGTGRPLIAIATRMPVVFSATVLPPAFGPLMTNAVRSRSSCTVVGTTVRVAGGGGGQDVVGGKRCPRGADDVGEDGAGLQRVELAAGVRGREDVAFVVDDGLRDEAGEARALLALLDQEVGEVVVQLDGRHRLDEERRAGAGALVQDAGDGVAMIGADGDAVAVAAQDDERLLNGVGAPVHDIGEDALDRRVLLLYALANGFQLGGRFFAQLAVAREVLVELREHRVEVGDGVRELREAWVAVAAQEGLADGLRGACGADDDPRLVELQHGLARKERRDIGEAGEREQTLAMVEAHHLREIGLRRLAFRERAQRTAPRDRILAEGGLCLEGDEGENALDLERRCVHVGH